MTWKMFRQLVLTWRKDFPRVSRMRQPGIPEIINSLLKTINGNRQYRDIWQASHLPTPCLDDCSMLWSKAPIKKIRSLSSLVIMAGILAKKNTGENLLYGKRRQGCL